MTKHNAQQYLHLVQALADGKTIQMRDGCNNNWADKDDIRFNLDPECYRIKPEPIKQEFYYVVRKETGVSPCGVCIYKYGSLDQVKNYIKQVDPKWVNYVIMHANATSVEDI